MQGIEADQADFRGADLRLANLGGAYLDGARMPHSQQPSLRAMLQEDAISPEQELSRLANGHDTGREHERNRGR